MKSFFAAWLAGARSKINWTQVLGVALSGLVVLNPNDVLSYIVVADPQTKVAIITSIQLAQGLATWVLRTWFTKPAPAQQ